MPKNSSLASLVAVTIFLFLVAPLSQAQAVTQFDLPAQSLAVSLRAVGSQTSTNVLFDPPLVEGMNSPGVKGEFTAEEAFKQLLVGTGLKYLFLDDRTVMVISEATAPASKPAASASESGPIRLAQADQSPSEMQRAENQNSSERSSAAVTEEIVVTARKREERLQDVPIAVAVVSGDFVRDQNIQRLDELGKSIPNFALSERTGPGVIGIRGISSGANRGFEQAVGQVVDGFFFGRQRFVQAGLLDVERIEVLKGPQGALIGKNTTAGAISITTAKPTDKLEASASVAYEVEGAEGLSAEGVISGPLFVPNLKGRIALSMEDRDGWVYNLATNQYEPKVDNFTGRVSLQWEPSETVSLLGQWTHGDYRRDGSSNQVSFCDPAFTAFLQARNIAEDCQADLTRNVLNPKNGQGNFEAFDTQLDTAGVTINWELGNHTITSLTGYAQMTYADSPDGDRTPLEVLNTISSQPDEDYQQLSQELRIASPAGGQFEYIAGVFVLHTEQDINNTSTTNLAAIGQSSAPFSNWIITDQKSDTYAVFGQLTWNWAEGWTVTVDGRFTYEEKAARQIEFPAFAYTLTPLPEPLPPGLRTHDISQDREEKDFSPGLTLKWSPNRDAMVYGTVRKGFKGGGFDAQANLSQADIVDNFQYGAEQVIAFELGAKLTLADGAIRLNAALFRSDFEDLQVSVVDNTSATTGLVFTRVGNAAKAVSQGAELDVTWRPLRNLKFLGALGYLDATYADYNGANCFRSQTVAQGCNALTGTQDLSGMPLIQTPKWAASMNTEYVWSLRNQLDIVGFVQGIYVDEFAMVEDRDPLMFQDSYWKFDASVTLRDADEKWSVSIIGRNLTDELTTMDGNDLPGVLPGFGYHRFVDPPRSIAVQARVSF